MAEHAHTTSTDRRTPATPAAPGRRSLFAGLGALALLPAAIPLATAVALEPDAVLIELCRECVMALDAYAACTQADDNQTDPLWLYIERLEGQIESIEATTMAGVVALAEVARHWARQPDGRLDFDTSFTGDWPEFVVLAVLRIAGGQA